MKFEQNTIDIIRNLNQITQSGIRFPEGNIISVADGMQQGDRMKGVTTVCIAELTQEITEELLVFDPVQFFSALSTFENPMIEVEGQTIIVRDEKTKKLGSFKIMMGAREVVGKGVTANEETFEGDDIIKLQLDADAINHLFKAVGIVVAPYIMFIGKDGDLLVRGHDKDNPTADQYNMPIGVTERDFQIPVKVESINKLMKGVDYDVTLTQKGIVRFVGDYKGNKLSYYFTASV